MATGYDNIGKGGIVKEGIFVRFPELIPACDERWWNDNLWHSRLLIVGESSYFNDDTPSVFKNPDLWYKGKDTKHLIPPSDDPENPKKYSNLVSNWKTDTKHVDRMLDSLREVSKMDVEYIYTEAMYYNYFLRPATGSKTFRDFCTPIDREVAGIALCGIIELDKPDIVIFASKYAYDEFRNYIKACGNKISFRNFGNYFELTGEISVRIEFVYHPTDRFHKWEKNENSKQKFERLLREYWIKK